ncbi:hypothetical protein B0H14DRAFT_3605446 [Mycena olivaceomarginata]|nr:hypothetical protein B0H14DRAFT_3605446 [Mycena olivaceomarginata]
MKNTSPTSLSPNTTQAAVFSIPQLKRKWTDSTWDAREESSVDDADGANNRRTPPRPPRKRHHAMGAWDSPDNPFVSSPLDDDHEVFQTAAKSSSEEKATVALVFRGVRIHSRNPYYKAGENPNSRLPPEHPDFEPDECNVRRMLFGVRRRSSTGPAELNETSNTSRRARKE